MRILPGIPTLGKENSTPGFIHGILGIGSTPTSHRSHRFRVRFQLVSYGLMDYQGRKILSLSQKNEFSGSACIPAPRESLIPG